MPTLGLNKIVRKDILFAELELTLIQPPPKQLVPKPKPIRVDHVRPAVVCDLLDTASVEVSLNLAAVDSVRLTGKSP